jgi:single-strand DNA-binding protein
MASYNRVVLVGNLTRDPEIRHLPSGMSVADIGLAVNERRKSKSGEWVEEVTFVDITLWDRQAEIAQEYTKKGSPLLVEGRLKLDTWETDGQKRSKLKVIGDRIVLLGSGGGRSDGDGGGYSQPAAKQQYSRQQPRQQQQAPQEEYYDAAPDDGDIPF